MHASRLAQWIAWYHGDRAVLWTWKRMMAQTEIVWPGERFYYAPNMN